MAIALLLCGLFTNVTLAAFTTHNKGVGNITIEGVGQTTFTITSTDKYYPGSQGTLDISLKYGSTGNMAVKLTDITIDNIEIGYSWLNKFVESKNGAVTLTISPRTGTWSAGNGSAGWYLSNNVYTYYTNSAVTSWRCTLDGTTPTFYYDASVVGGTTLPTFQCDVIIAPPPTGDIQNGVIDGVGVYVPTGAYMLDGCTGIKFNFSLLASQV